MAATKRSKIKNKAAKFRQGYNPLKGVNGISGVRVYDVGQGDAMCVLDLNGEPILQVDYGGVQAHPFKFPGAAEQLMPISGVRVVMLSHWDKDHWWSATKNSCSNTVPWLVPRQITSTSAVKFSWETKTIQCIPEHLVRSEKAFSCDNDDYVMFEKIAPMPMPPNGYEDCNKTGVAFSVVQHASKKVILLPGDANFHAVPHYDRIQSGGGILRGVVAFHHGSGVDWDIADTAFLANWTRCTSNLDVVFSYAKDNSYDHPNLDNYECLPSTRNSTMTPDLRAIHMPYKDILF